MSNRLRRLLPHLVIISLVGNLYLTWQIYDRDRSINQVWGSSVPEALKYLAWDRVDLTPSPEGKLPASGASGVWLGLDELKALHNLPNYSRRVDEADMLALTQFLRYAGQVSELARREQKERGAVGPETRKLLTGVNAGLESLLRYHSAFNKASDSINPWNHATWRGIWHAMAVELRSMEFPPLPQ